MVRFFNVKIKDFFFSFLIRGCEKKAGRMGVKWSSIARGPAICHASDVIFIKVYWKRNG